jgi:hypothetical protein
VNPFCLVSDRFAVSNREAMIQAQEDGFLTGFWTVNCPDAIRDVILWGANMVTTDYPPRVAAFIREYIQVQRHRESDSWRPAMLGSMPARQVPLGPAVIPSPQGDPSANEEGVLRGV